ncbi:hypothetical protein CGC49_04210 [Capnocytophaga sp. H4358]|uniref:DUF6427 family protein n=1 Tax=Capnocytophaga sp. H4358 TaxID=1945658 RepID=UPI000BB1AF8E|nr:DUF6427 family protein [Capnocytophaga sp. H4358]ATA72569.1 hypothetical protein CGC49_04210 [Capnocytophaga sp. H4358]
MISNRFENRKPANLLAVILAVIFGQLLYEFFIFDTIWKVWHVFRIIGVASLLYVTLYFLNKIDRWNELTQGNSYSLLFFGVFVILFPTAYTNLLILASNLLITIAIWRMLSLKNERNIPQKIFDVSFLILCAGLFNVYALFFLLNVWISLLLYRSKKKKYWLIPFFAIFCVGILSSVMFLVLDLTFTVPSTGDLWDFSYQKALHPPMLFSLILMGFILITSLLVYFFKNKYHSGSSQLIVQILSVGLIVTFFSKEPVFIFTPLSILFALYVEKITKKWLKETVLWSLLTIPLVVLLLHFISES